MAAKEEREERRDDISILDSLDDENHVKHLNPRPIPKRISRMQEVSVRFLLPSFERVEVGYLF